MNLFSGPKGSPGLQGEAGATGATGIPGFPGPPGVSGPRVDPGTAVPAGSVSCWDHWDPSRLCITTGPRGLPGSHGPVGPTGKYHWLLQVSLLSVPCLSVCLSVCPYVRKQDLHKKALIHLSVNCCIIPAPPVNCQFIWMACAFGMSATQPILG